MIYLENTEVAIKNGQSRETGNIGYKDEKCCYLLSISMNKSILTIVALVFQTISIIVLLILLKHIYCTFML